MGDGRLARDVGGRPGLLATVGADARGDDDLALHERDAPALPRRRAEAAAARQRVPVPGVEELEEREDGEVRPRGVDVHRLRERRHVDLVEQLPPQCRHAQRLVERLVRPQNPRVRHEEVHLSGFPGDGVYGALQRCLAGYIALQRGDARVRGRCCFEDARASA